MGDFKENIKFMRETLNPIVLILIFPIWFLGWGWTSLLTRAPKTKTKLRGTITHGKQVSHD